MDFPSLGVSLQGDMRVIWGCMGIYWVYGLRFPKIGGYLLSGTRGAMGIYRDV